MFLVESATQATLRFHPEPSVSLLFLCSVLLYLKKKKIKQTISIIFDFMSNLGNVQIKIKKTPTMSSTNQTQYRYILSGKVYLLLFNFCIYFSFLTRKNHCSWKLQKKPNALTSTDITLGLILMIFSLNFWKHYLSHTFHTSNHTLVRHF